MSKKQVATWLAASLVGSVLAIKVFNTTTDDSKQYLGSLDPSTDPNSTVTAHSPKTVKHSEEENDRMCYGGSGR